MPAISIFGRSQLEGAERIDAEYYQPSYLELVRVLRQRSCVPLKNTKAKLDCSAFYPSIAPLYTRKGTPFLRVDDIHDGFVELTVETAFLPASILQENLHTIAHCVAGDIVIAKGGNTIAKAGMLSDDYAKYATGRDLIILRTDSLSINRFYLLAYLLSRYGKSLMIRTASQTGQPHLTLSSLKELAVPLLSRQLQNKIGTAIVDAWDSFRLAKAKFGKATDLLLEYAQLQNWRSSHTLSFNSDFREISSAGRTDAEHFQTKYKELRKHLQALEQGSRLLTDIARNSDEDIDPRVTPDREFKYVELADINEKLGVIETVNIIRGEEAPSRARMLLRAGDVILSTVEGSLDKAALVSSDYDSAIGSTGFFVLRAKNVETEYL